MQLERRGEELALVVRDNGRGLPTPPGDGKRGMGMIGMRVRARSLGGDMTVNSRPGEGVDIRVSIPVQHEAHSHSVS
jgi:signal transduction histidine kinase